MTTVFTSRKGQGIRELMSFAENKIKGKVYIQLKAKVWQLRIKQ